MGLTSSHHNGRVVRVRQDGDLGRISDDINATEFDIDPE